MLSRFEQFTAVISAIHRDIQKIERDEMEKQGLRGAYAQYFLALLQNPQGLTAAELAEICDRDKAAVSRAVSELEAKGYLLRPGGASPYRAPLFLTEQGQKTAGFVAERAALAVDRAGNGLSEANREVFYACLNRISANLQAISKDGIDHPATT